VSTPSAPGVSSKKERKKMVCLKDNIPKWSEKTAKGTCVGFWLVFKCEGGDL